MEFNSPIIEQPIAFEDPQIKETNEKYLKEVKMVDSSPDIDPIYGDSISYMASYVGISREEWKEKFLSTNWFASNMGFLVGLVDWIPLDRRCTLRTSKSNPPRVWTCRGAVGFGSFLLSWYPVAAAGGYHLMGRTSPLLQFEQKHPSFKEDVALYHTLDRIKWYEVSPSELLRIEKDVDSGSSDFVYKKTPGRFSVGDWLESDRQHKDEIDAWFKQIEENAAKAPVP
jgi:allophanate hydrolase subunit 1